MASVNSLKVASSSGRSTRDLSNDHVSTIDFNVVKPMGVYELVPGDHITINPEVWMRTQAMNVPTFGKMDVITRAFFVPLRLTWKHFNDFYRQAPVNAFQSHILQYFSEVPHANMHDLSNEFLRRFEVCDSETEFRNYNRKITNMEGLAQRLHFGAQLQSSGVTGNTSVDFTVRDLAALFNYQFNPIGKRVYDLFNSLGYRWQFFVFDSDSSSNKGTEQNSYDVSILPLLGWLKMFKDWYCPSEFKFLFSDTLTNGTLNVDPAYIKILFDELTWAVFIYFNDDIFSMCEQAPYRKGNAVNPDGIFITQLNGEPNSLLGQNNLLDWHTNSVKTDKVIGATISDFSGSASGTAGRGYVNLNGKEFLGSADPTDQTKAVYSGRDKLDTFVNPLNSIVSSWSVQAVMRTAEWLQRNNLLSSRVTEYLKSKFGVTPTAARLDQAEYIGHAGAPIRISDVAGTTDGNLADLGAKGTSYSIDKLSYTAEEFGYLYFTVELRPRIGYGQGVDPLVLRTKLTEFYNSEFDSLGFEPVPTECLASGPLTFENSHSDEVLNDGSNDNRIFGYLPRLWSYKCKHDNLSGDFLLPYQMFDGDMQSYHLMRTVDSRYLDDFVHNSISFRYAGLSMFANRFGRIFRNDGTYDLKDHFMLITSFEAYVNGLPLAMNESWQVNPDHNEREGHLTNIQGSL